MRRGSPTRVASILGVHPNTARALCRAAVEGDPGAKLHDVRRHPITGYYLANLEEVRALAEAEDVKKK